MSDEAAASIRTQGAERGVSVTISSLQPLGLYASDQIDRELAQIEYDNLAVSLIDRFSRCRRLFTLLVLAIRVTLDSRTHRALR
jgi:hypothetical protein